MAYRYSSWWIVLQIQMQQIRICFAFKARGGKTASFHWNSKMKQDDTRYNKDSVNIRA